MCIRDRKNTLYSYLYIYSFDEEVDLLNTYTLGIDIGSTTVKIAILDENDRLLSVSYTHLDVYKRQPSYFESAGIRKR